MNAENKHTVCPNCQTSFDKTYNYCPACGQENKELKLDLKYFLAELLSGMFNLDSKIFRTLKLLFFKPGKLTKEFIAGRRNSYIQPVRLYLVGSFVFFTITALINQVDVPESTEDHSFLITINDSIQQPEIQDEVLEPESGDSSYLDKIMQEKSYKLKTKSGRRALKEKFRNFIPIGMFIFIPLTALLFFVLFRRKKYYVEHLVFVLHFQTLVYLLLTLEVLIEIFYSGDILSVLMAILFISLLIIWIKKYYENGWGTTILKTMLLLLTYSVMLVAFFVVIVLISFLTL